MFWAGMEGQHLQRESPVIEAKKQKTKNKKTKKPESQCPNVCLLGCS